MTPVGTFVRSVRSVWAITALLAGVLVLSTGIRFAMAQHQAAESTEPSDSYGELLAAAIRELFLSEQDSGAVDKMIEVRRNAIRDRKLTAREDPFPGWLAAQLLKGAMDGTLFVEDDDEISLRITWDMGDRENAYWYVASASILEHDGSRGVTNEPWLLWRYLGTMVTPDGPADRPWISDYKLSGVSHGDIVMFDLYCLPRDFVDSHIRLDPITAIEDDAARLVLRLPLPVILAGN